MNQRCVTLLVKSAASFEKNDLVMATQVWANDESLSVFESGHANYGWADYRGPSSRAGNG